MKNDTRTLLEAVKAGSVSVDDALAQLKNKPYDDLGYAKVDLHRKIMQGSSEVIYGAGKTAEQISGIVQSLIEHGQDRILITRLDAAKAEAVAVEMERAFAVRPGAGNADAQAASGSYESRDATGAAGIAFRYDAQAQICLIGDVPEPDGIGTILVATGGTSDIPVAEEAALTAEMLGNTVHRAYDVGVAGLHRTLSKLDEIERASVIIAVAGMEGALASLIGGLADCPVIAVPTSVGYGASFSGLAALLSMLNSCAAGVGVVNIDNGFGAGYLASMINHMEVRA